MKEGQVCWDTSYGYEIQIPFVKYLSSPEHSEQGTVGRASRDAASLAKTGCILPYVYTKTNFISIIMKKALLMTVVY
jgi:hypothetical protein